MMSLRCFACVDDDVADLLARACHEYVSVYGDSRSTVVRLPRSDKGKKRGPREGPICETEWVKRRRVAVANAVAARGVPRDPGVSPHDQWTATHQKEFDLQRRRQGASLVSAYEDGTLLPHEKAGQVGMDVKLEAMQIARAAQDLVRKRGHAKCNLTLVKHTPVSTRHLFLEPATALALGPDSMRALRAQCRKLHVELVADRLQADMVLVSSVAQLGQRTTWCLALCGGSAVTYDYIIKNFKSGTALVFKKAVASKRLIYVSDAFRLAHPELARILDFKASGEGSKWKFLAKDVFLHKAAGANKVVKNLLVAFVTHAEQGSAEFSTVKLKLTNTNAQRWLSKLVPGACCMNICGN
jgi:hypothetical protein